jgi:hypothetical protein
MVEFKHGSTAKLYCEIPAGNCIHDFIAECFLVANPEDTMNYNSWQRPPGSIIASKNIFSSELAQGGFFPIKVIDGDGKHLIYMDFFNTHDLNVSAKNAFIVYIDSKHPFAAGYNEKPQVRSLILIMVIQSFAKKLFNQDIYTVITEYGEDKNSWSAGSLGGSFNWLKEILMDKLGTSTPETLRDLYNETPERIDRVICEIFTIPLN